MSTFFSPHEPAAVDAILRTLGADRSAGYLAASRGVPEKAVRLYLWNAALAGAFLPMIGIVEVALRNAVSDRLAQTYGAAWYDDPRFVTIDSKPFQRSIDRAKSHITSGGKIVTPSRMVSQLMFGFWVSLLRPGYARSLWPMLRPAFAPYVRRRRVADVLDPLVAFRNRVAHHEVIYDREPRLMYERLIIAAQLLSPGLELWIRYFSQVDALLAKGPYST